MTMDPTEEQEAPEPRPAAEGVESPWAGLEEGGASLAIDDFLTTMMSHASNALRRAITVPYAEQAGLTVSEWRMLSVLAEARQLPFMELVTRSAADKAQVSRTLRLLESRGLLSLHAERVTSSMKGSWRASASTDSMRHSDTVRPACSA